MTAEEIYNKERENYFADLAQEVVALKKRVATIEQCLDNILRGLKSLV